MRRGVARYRCESYQISCVYKLYLGVAQLVAHVVWKLRFLIIFENKVMLDITQQKGLATEIHCLQDLTELGLQCLIPFGDSCKYDIAVDINGKIYKIQCKTSHWCKDTSEEKVAFAIETNCQTTNTKKTTTHKYTENEIDYFYTWFQGQGYLISIKEATGVTYRMRYEYPKTGQKQGIHIANDYKIEEEVEKLLI